MQWLRLYQHKMVSTSHLTIKKGVWQPLYAVDGHFLVGAAALVTHMVFCTQNNILIMFQLVISSLNLHQEFQWPQRTMVACPRQHSMAAPFLSTPLSPVTGDLKIYYYHNFLAKTVVRNPDHFEDALRRLTTSTVPPSITTTHHDGTLSSSLSYTLTNDDYPLPSAPIQCSRQHLREMHRFQNDAWTKWDAVQFMDELEANRVTDKADSESWKK